MSTTRIILSYRKNTGTERKPVWSEWKWTAYAPLDNPIGVADIIEKFNYESRNFSTLEYKIDIGTIGKGGVIRHSDADWIVEEFGDAA
ncbi:MAG: hypothetical protein L7V15_08095 [Burkholderiales bacterium]|nr:hypothetical protein [Burkholderiales bacterium]